MTPTSSEIVRRVAVLGLGEAGGAISRDLAAAGADVRGFDPLVPAPVGVEPRSSDADAVRDADIVLCLTSAHEAAAALHAARPTLRPDAIWADLNAASPQFKATLSTATGGATVVDVAIMAPVPGKGLRAPMVASGPRSDELADYLNKLGGKVTVLAGPVGAASSRKLLRSVFYKGLAAAVVEALAGADAAGCREWLYDNICSELTHFDETTIDRIVTGTHEHARRRTDEMLAAAEQLRQLGVKPLIATAAAKLLGSIPNE